MEGGRGARHRLASERFDIREKIGAGGMGVVYLAFDRKLRSQVALKMLLEADGRALYRFKREFRSLQDVSHPNLLSLHELHTNDQEWFFSMELVEGEPFSEYVRPWPADAPLLSGGARQRVRAGRVDLGRLREAFYQLADGVCALHCLGKIHRDLKPSNVLVERGGRVVLLDFGLVGDTALLDAEKTHEMVAVGTPMYMSPEQAADVPLTPASDWYSVGVMLYEALTGMRPFEDGARGREIYLRKQTETPVPVAELAPDAPRELLGLCDALVQRNPQTRPTGPEVLERLGRAPSIATCALRERAEAQPFVGRRAELETLRRAYADSRRAPVVVFIQGLAGMGKSMLMRNFIDSLPDEDGAVVLLGRCYERDVVPHPVVDTLMDSLSRYLLELSPAEVEALLPGDVAAMARLFPALERVPAIAAPSRRRFASADPHQLRRRALEAIGELFGRIAEQSPLILCIEDVAWSDPDAAMFMAGLLSSDAAPRMMVVGCFRPEDHEANPIRAEFVSTLRAGDTDRVRTIELGPFDVTDLDTLISSAGGAERQLDSAVLLRESEGSPALAAELMRFEARRGAATLDELLTARIDSLSPDERALLRVCAVATEPVASELALRAAGASGAEALITSLRAARLLRSRRDGGGAILEPYQERVREAVSRGIDPDQRRELHRSLALAYEEHGSANPEILVEHWLGAGHRERVARFALQSARAAELRCAFHRAADYFKIGLEHGRPDRAERQQLLSQLGAALANAGRLDEAAEVYARAAAGADGTERLLLLRREVEQVLRRGRLEAGLALARTLLGELDVPLPRGRGTAIADIVYSRVRLRLRGLEPTTRSPTPAEEARLEVLWSLAIAIGHLDPLRGQALQARFIREALDAGAVPAISRALSSECIFRALRGERNRAQAEQLHARALELAGEDPQLVATAEGGLGMAYLLFGRWREAADRFEASERLLREHVVDARWNLDTMLVMRVSALFSLGEIGELVRLVPGWLREARDRGDVYALRGLQGTRGNTIWLAKDRPDQARERLDAVKTRLDGAFHMHHFYELVAAVHIDLYGDDPHAASRRLEPHWSAIARSPSMRVELVRIEAWHLRARAALRVAAASADRKAALQQVDAAANHLERESAPWSQPLAHAVRATAASLRGRNDLAIALLRAAIAGFESSGMGMHASTARLHLGALIGGDEGATLRTEADAALRAQTIARPEAFARITLPGFGG